MTYSRPDTPTTSNPQYEPSHEGLIQELRKEIATLEKVWNVYQINYTLLNSVL